MPAGKHKFKSYNLCRITYNLSNLSIIEITHLTLLQSYLQSTLVQK